MTAQNGGNISVGSNYSISGGANAHVATQYGGVFLCLSKTITTSGTPAFSDEFAYCAFGGSIQDWSGCTFSGSGATGTRYSAVLNGVINTNGGGSSFLPGNSSGGTSTGGQYA